MTALNLQNLILLFWQVIYSIFVTITDDNFKTNIIFESQVLLHLTSYPFTTLEWLH